ncbi:MAG TPA: hypothetical protein VNW30_00680 [Opitutaceae bacterium]|jgi:hypothetical protein|nr:hypothetical protein [Opitutaceae bacterium]
MPINAQTLLHSAAAYPPWLVTVCAVVAGIFVLWLVGKLLKWSLMVIAATVLVLGAAALVWLVFR